MQKAALGWLVWETTASAAWVAAIALSDLIAMIWSAPLVGAVTDRNNPFKLLIVTLGSLCVLSLLLWAMTASGQSNVWLLLLWASIYATFHGFNHPVRMIAVGALASNARMSQAIAMNSIAVNVARSIGPLLAGIVILNVGIAEAFLGGAIAYTLMAIAVVILRKPLDRPGYAGTSRKIGMDIASGFSYVLHTPHIFFLLVLAFGFAVFARPFVELYPAIAGMILDGGPDTLALLMSAQGVGATIGAIWMLRRREAGDLPKLMRISGFLMGISLALMAFAPAPWLIIACIGFAGLFHVVANISMQSIAQLFSKREMRGRVVALYGMIFRAVPALGALVIGFGANWVPLDWLLSAGGVLFCLMVLVTPRKHGQPVGP